MKTQTNDTELVRQLKEGLGQRVADIDHLAESIVAEWRRKGSGFKAADRIRARAIKDGSYSKAFVTDCLIRMQGWE